MIMLNQILLKAPKHRIAMENKVQNILVQLYITKPATSSFITISKFVVTNILYICYHDMVIFLLKSFSNKINCKFMWDIQFQNVVDGYSNIYPETNTFKDI